MTIKFLCSDCRSWLTSNLLEVPARCDTAYRWGVERYRKGELDTALRNVGAAFEMSEIMVSSAGIPSSYVSDCLHATSRLLVRVLSEMGRVKDSADVQTKTVFLSNRLSGEVFSQAQDIEVQLAAIAASAIGARSAMRFVH